MTGDAKGPSRSRRKPTGADLALAAVAAQAQAANGLPDELRWAEGMRRLGRAWRIFLLALREAGAGLALIFAAGFDGAFARRLRRGAVSVAQGLGMGLLGIALVVRFLIMLPVRFVMFWAEHPRFLLAVLVIGALGWLAVAVEAARTPLLWLGAIAIGGAVVGYVVLVVLLVLGDWEFKRQAAKAETPAQQRDRQSLGMGDLAGYGLVALARYALMAAAAGAVLFALVQAGKHPTTSGVAVLVGIGAVTLLLLPLAIAAFSRERARWRRVEAEARALRAAEALAPRPSPPRVEPVAAPPPPPPPPPPPLPPPPPPTPQPVAVARAPRTDMEIEATWAARDDAREPFRFGELWADIAPLLVALAACAVVGGLVLQFGPWGLLWLALSAALILAVRRTAPTAADAVDAASAARRDALGDAASIIWLGLAGGIALGLGFAAAIVSAATVLLVALIAATVLFLRFTIGAIVARAITLILAMLARVRAPDWRADVERRLRAIATPLVVVACIAVIAVVAVNTPRLPSASKQDALKPAVPGPVARPAPKPTPAPTITLAADGARTPLAFAFGYRDRLEGAGAASIALSDLAIDGVCGPATLYAVGATSAAGAARANDELARRRAIALGRHFEDRVSTCAAPRPAIVAITLAPAQGGDDRAQRAPLVVTDLSTASIEGRSATSACLVAPGQRAAPAGPEPCPTWTLIPGAAR